MALSSVTKLKVGYVFVLLAINFAGMLPIRWKFFRANATFLSVLNCFAAGVFLAMAFVHILPESVSTYNNVMYESRGLPPIGGDDRRRRRLAAEMNSTVEGEGSESACDYDYPDLFPVPYVLFLTGYALVLLVDRIMKGGDHDHSHGHEHGGDDHSHFPDLDEFEHDEDGHNHKHAHDHSHDDHAGHSHVHHHGDVNGHKHDHGTNG